MNEKYRKYALNWKYRKYAVNTEIYKVMQLTEKYKIVCIYMMVTQEFKLKYCMQRFSLKGFRERMY